MRRPFQLAGRVRWRSCECGAAGGGYASAAQAYYAGPAGTHRVGVHSPEFVMARNAAAEDAVNRQPRYLGHEFEAFVIPWNAPTMRPCAVAGALDEDGLDAAEHRARETAARVEILRNAARCSACGETVVSWRDRHHLARCTCGATAVDGGAAYRRHLGATAVSDAHFVVAYPPVQTRGGWAQALCEGAENARGGDGSGDA